jgi:hypothetical protein
VNACSAWHVAGVCRIRLIESDEFIRDEPDRLALGVRPDPRLVRTPCPGSDCLRFAAIGTLNRYREVF